MKKFKGTRGKWHVGQDGITVYDENGFDVADLSHPMRIRENWHEHGVQHWGEKEGVTFVDVPDEEAEANANLIAAAPELLKTLQNMQLSMMAHPDYASGRSQEFIDYVDIAEEVINKALGKEK